MLKIKLLKETKTKKVVKKNTPLNPIQEHNIQFLLEGKYVSGDKYSDPSIIKNFLEDMANQRFEDTGDPDIFEKVYDNVDRIGLIEEVVKEVRPLRNNKIVKAITGASFGKVFKLDNHHILKIFLGGVDVASDMEWFRKNSELIHRGEGKRTTLPVYDWEWGEDAPLLPSFPEYKIGFVEMAEFEPLDDFLKRTGRAEGDSALHQLRAAFQHVYSSGKKDLESGFKSILFDLIDVGNLIQFDDEEDKNNFNNLKNKKISDIISYLSEKLGESKFKNPFDPLTIQESLSILESFYDMLDIGFSLSDVAPRNLARLIQSDPANPTIIIFDR